MIHQNPNQFKILINSIYHEENIYLIHIDKKASSKFHSEAGEIIREFKNVYILQSQIVNRCMWSLTDVQLNAIKFLFDLKIHWDYFINLSGQCFPLKSQNFIMDHLSKFKGNYITVGNPSDLGIINDNLLRQRNHYQENENEITKITDNAPLLTEYSKGKYNFYSGSGWFFLTREFCKYVLESNEAQEIKQYIKTSFISDENYFHTILMNSEFLMKPAFPNKRHLIMDVNQGGGHPIIYTENDFIELITSDDFFARKFDINLDSNILKMLQFHISR
jgi:hypothetical protein